MGGLQHSQVHQSQLDPSNSKYSESFAGHLLEAAFALDKLKEAQASQELTKNILDHLSGLGPLHDRKCEKLQSKLIAQSLQVASYTEQLDGFRKIPYSEQDLQQIISQVLSSIKELDTKIIPALRNCLGTTDLRSGLEDRHVELTRVEQEMGLELETMGLEGLDERFDDFMDWEGGSNVPMNSAVSEADVKEDKPAEDADLSADPTDQIMDTSYLNSYLVMVPIPGLIKPKHNIEGLHSSLLKSLQHLVEKRHQIEELSEENNMSRDAIADISSRIAALETSAASRRKELKFAKNCIGRLGLFCSSLDMKDSRDAMWTVTTDTIEKDVVPILDRLKYEVVKDV